VGLATSATSVLWRAFDGSLFVTDVNTLSSSLPVDSDGARTAAISPGSSWAAVVDTNELIVWQPGFDLVKRFPSTTVVEMIFLTERHLLLVDDRGDANVLDVERDTAEAIDGFGPVVRSLAFIPDRDASNDFDVTTMSELDEVDAPVVAFVNNEVSFRWLSSFDEGITVARGTEGPALSVGVVSDDRASAAASVFGGFAQAGFLFINVMGADRDSATLRLPLAEPLVSPGTGVLRGGQRPTLRPGWLRPSPDGKTLVRHQDDQLVRVDLDGSELSSETVGYGPVWEWRSGRIEQRGVGGRPTFSVVSLPRQERRRLDVATIVDVRNSSALACVDHAGATARVGLVDLDTLGFAELFEVSSPLDVSFGLLSPNGVSAVALVGGELRVASTQPDVSLTLSAGSFDARMLAFMTWVDDRFLFFADADGRPVLLDVIRDRRRMLGEPIPASSVFGAVVVLPEVPQVMRQALAPREVGPTPPNRGPSAPLDPAGE
jgi:hypothetical protein